MNAAIADEIPADLEFIKGYRIVNAVENVTCKKSTVYPAESGKYHVALMDYGAKRNIIRELVKRGCKVTVRAGFYRRRGYFEIKPRRRYALKRPGRPCGKHLPNKRN